MKNFIDSVRAGKYTKDVLHIRHGHNAACLSHLANLSYRVGKSMKTGEVRERLEGDKLGQEIFAEFLKNLEANHIDLEKAPITAGPWLNYDPAANKFTGEFSDEANKLCEEEYAAGFELPEV